MQGLSAFLLKVNRRFSRQPYWVLVAELTAIAVLLSLGIVVSVNALIFRETIGLVIVQTALSTFIVSSPLISLSVSALRRQLIGARDLRQALDLANRRLNEANVAREVAEAATNDKSRLISNVSHELRSPLMAIVSYTELLIEVAGEEGRDEMVRDLKKVERASMHLTELVDRAFDLSEDVHRHVQVRIVPVSIVILMAEVEAICRPSIATTSNTFEVIVPQDPGTIETDPLMVRQILTNLVSNAAKFSKDGRISVEVMRGEAGAGADNVIKFVVRDTGWGIAKKDLDAIFQPFFRTDEALPIPGSGIGLAISRSYARSLGGDISVLSAKGVGSVFTLAIPVAPPSPSDSGLPRNGL